MKPVAIDLFCGLGGWTDALMEAGFTVYGFDINPQPKYKGIFIQADILQVTADDLRAYNPSFVTCSSPCEEFSVHGMKCFHPNPKYPAMGIRLFEHSRSMLEELGVPYVMENVRAAQQFVGNAKHHCGPFYLWGNAVPPLMPQGVQKGVRLGKSGFSGPAQVEWRKKHSNPARDSWSGSEKRAEAVAKIAMIPPELARCVADYAGRLIEVAA